MSSGTHSAKRERATAEGFGGQNGKRKNAEFLFQVQADISAERHSPSCARARQCRNLFSFAHPPSLFYAVPSGTASASSLNDGLSLQVSPPLWSGRAHGPVRGCHPGRRRCEDGTVPVRFTWTWDWLLGISYPILFIVSSRISFSARPLSDVAASQVPSVAAAAVLHFNHNSEDATLAVPIGFLSSFTYFLVFGVFHWSLFLLLWFVELGRTYTQTIGTYLGVKYLLVVTSSLKVCAHSVLHRRPTIGPASQQLLVGLSSISPRPGICSLLTTIYWSQEALNIALACCYSSCCAQWLACLHHGTRRVEVIRWSG